MPSTEAARRCTAVAPDPGGQVGAHRDAGVENLPIRTNAAAVATNRNVRRHSLGGRAERHQSWLEGGAGCPVEPGHDDLRPLWWHELCRTL